MADSSLLLSPANRYVKYKGSGVWFVAVSMPDTMHMPYFLVNRQNRAATWGNKDDIKLLPNQGILALIYG